jgi:predicted RNase H-like HicB family nuclease
MSSVSNRFYDQMANTLVNKAFYAEPQIATENDFNIIINSQFLLQSCSTNSFFAGWKDVKNIAIASSPKEKIREIVLINELINFKYSLRKPIKVTIEWENGEYLADIEDLEIYSFGKTKDEVLREVNQELTELFEELLTINENNIGQHPKKWKKILSEYIQLND